MGSPDSRPRALPGGRPSIEQIGETVHRPVGYWSPAVHALLDHLADSPFDAAPKRHGFDEQGREVLDFLPGEVGHYPLSEAVRSEQALVSSARLLARYHAAVRLPNAQLPDDGWLLPAREPREVLCHNDFAPYNVVFEGERAVGLIDFDAAAPGPLAWDLAYALYRFAPLTTSAPAELQAPATQIGRAVRFLDAYEAATALRIASLELVPVRLQALIDHMRRSAQAGDDASQAAMAAGHAEQYARDLAYQRIEMPGWLRVAAGRR